MKLGIVGLPNVGKSTLFNALTNAGASSVNYLFATREPNVGIVPVPDKRLDALAEIYDPKKITPAVLEVVDIAGLVRGAAGGEGLGNKFLSSIREVDAIIHVVRCFEDSEVLHVDGDVNPARDIETVRLELVFADIDIVGRRLDRTQKAAKADKKLLNEADFLDRLKAHLEDGNPAIGFDAGENEAKIIAEMPLLSNKPVIYIANLGERDFRDNLQGNKFYKEVCEIAAADGSEVLPVCAKFEESISGMSNEDKLMFLADLGLSESGLDRIIQAGYALLGLISFLTAGKPEVRAWTITKGTKAQKAAGKIHTDLERGFIRAEVISFDDLIPLKSIAAAKEKGLVRLEGKEYAVKDGDVILFRFNV
ncbi:MAG: redox-regulated ATPase YchF [Oscillospiraceae bacterium]|nr:redox-regulated ATPase YchF [Oscillospiraceae bacterium]